MRYIGSKKPLIELIIEIIEQSIPNLQEREFADLFSGTGTVSFNFSNRVQKIISNDLEYYSFVIGCALLKCPSF